MAEGMEKIYCYPTHDNSQLLAELINAKGNGTDAVEMAALFSQNNNWMNNPFMYLVWMSMFAGNGFYGNRGFGDYDTQSRLDSIQNQISDNHNNDLAISAIRGSEAAVHELAGNLNVSATALGNQIDNIRDGITRIGGQFGIGTEKVINGIILGNKDLLSALQSCCCENKLLATQQGYENRISGMQNTSNVLGRIDQLANGITQGFSATAYATQQQTCDIINAIKDSNQRTADLLNQHWVENLHGKLAQQSQDAQTARLIAEMRQIAQG